MTPTQGSLAAHDIDEGVVFSRNGVAVSAFTVDHGNVAPAFGYRIDYGGQSVVLSGDTRLSAWARLRVIAIRAFILFLGAAPTQAETGFLDRSVVIGGETHRYQAYVPAEYTPRRSGRQRPDTTGSSIKLARSGA